MPRLYLGLLLHNHQPVGNYGFVIEHVYEQSYRPMLEALERHPGVRIALHTSGPLFDWIMEHRPDYMTRLRALCDRGQVEMVSGGYYEPVLPMIPDGDKVGQIRMLTRFIEERFGQTPDGLWLTERVWEPGLPAPLADAGIGWTLVDDAHFRTVGVRDEDLDGYYITEEQGKRVRLFAGSQRLRYTIPWQNVDELISDLYGLAERSTRDGPYIVLGDDGEKFGGWPTTHDHVWEKGWIERFFTALEDAGDWLETLPPGAYARRFEARGLVYLPAASYAEMMEWSMPAASAAEYHRVSEQAEHQGRADILRYLRGGFWRFFLAKYPEANAMHKRGLRIDAKLSRVDDAAARDALWRGQCNCPYWHGVFGGLYLRHVRRATNSNLVRAERLADEAAGRTGVHVESRDVDFDGHLELLAQSPALSLLLHPRFGGMLSELDFRRRDHALLDVLARRPEAYHEGLTDDLRVADGGEATNIHGGVRVKEEGLTERLIFDRYRRGGLQEWIFDDDVTPEAHARQQARAQFAPEGAWRVETSTDDGCATLRLAREAGGWALSKTLRLGDDEALDVAYSVTNAGAERRTARFLSEWNLTAPQADDGDDRAALLRHAGGDVDAHGPAGTLPCVSGIALSGSAAWRVSVTLEPPADVWHAPVDSVSSSEGGLESVVQGVSVSFAQHLDLAPGESREFRIVWRAADD
ncbi:MAG: DUF1926 domain-containing protein [Chloroflexi bacterium]|nr:DUF1926 domain-containing protein [Chloroflexota bacterium]